MNKKILIALAVLIGIDIGAGGIFLIQSKKIVFGERSMYQYVSDMSQATEATSTKFFLGEFGKEHAMPAEDSISGAYLNSDGRANITLKKIQNNLYRITGTAIWGEGENIHDGEIDGTVFIDTSLRGQYASDIEKYDSSSIYGCVLNIDLRKENTLVVEDVLANGCGGLNVSFADTYTKE